MRGGSVSWGLTSVKCSVEQQQRRKKKKEEEEEEEEDAGCVVHYQLCPSLCATVGA